MGKHDLQNNAVGRSSTRHGYIEGHRLYCIDAYPGAHCPGGAVITVESRHGVLQLKDTEPIVKCEACGRFLQVGLQWQFRAQRPPDAPDIPNPEDPVVLTNIKERVLGGV